MPEPLEGVIPSATPADPDPQLPDDPAAPGVTGEVVDPDTLVGDRPARNIIAELDRKVESRFNTLRAEILSALGSVSRPAAPVSTSRDYSDEELAQLAAAGDARALDTLTDRKAARQSAQHVNALSQAQQEQAALATLLSRFPVLRDDTHPLTRYATNVKLALMRGGAAESAALIVESIKTAIADNPDLAASAMSRPAASRPSVPAAVAAAPAPRRTPSPAKKAELTDAQWALAKRYGYKTREAAAQAIERTEQRRASGASSLGAIGLMIDNVKER